jgi:hypothetical protein
MSSSSQSIEAAVQALRSKLVDLGKDKSVHMTVELVTELNGIINSLDSLRLDSLFLANSPNWQANFVPKLAHDQYRNIFEALFYGYCLELIGFPLLHIAEAIFSIFMLIFRIDEIYCWCPCHFCSRFHLFELNSIRLSA